MPGAAEEMATQNANVGINTNVSKEVIAELRKKLDEHFTLESKIKGRMEQYIQALVNPSTGCMVGFDPIRGIYVVKPTGEFSYGGPGFRSKGEAEQICKLVGKQAEFEKFNLERGKKRAFATISIERKYEDILRSNFPEVSSVARRERAKKRKLEVMKEIEEKLSEIGIQTSQTSA